MSSTAVIADDEPALREALRRRLAAVWPELEIVAEAENGTQALEAIGEWEPTIAFLDIRMPGLDGLEVAQRVAGRCHVVFVTAYDEYAVKAFEAQAIDYLLKPVTEERLGETVERLQSRLADDVPSVRMTGLLQRLAAQLGRVTPSYLHWIRAAQRESVRMIAVEEIRCFLAADKYTSLFCAEGELLIRKPIKELEAELDPKIFWRVHRNAIVNVGFVEVCYRDGEGRQRLKMRGLTEELVVSRAYAHLFKQM